MRAHKVYHSCGSIQRSILQRPANDTNQREVKPVTSSRITVSTDDASIDAYLTVVEEGPDVQRAGVILLSDIYGLDNEDTKKVADLFASYSIPTSTFFNPS